MKTGEFSVDQLLLAGLIWDHGQLTPTQRRELNKRARGGKLVKERKFFAEGQIKTLWRLPHVFPKAA